MKPPRPAAATLAAFVVILVVVGLVGGVLLWATDGATAIQVGDRTVSRETLNDELREWAEFGPARARTTTGAVTGAAGAGIATQVVYELLAQQYLDRTGESVTASDRAEARDSVASVEQEFEARPRWWQERYLDRRATYNAITRLVGTDDQFTEEFRVLRREARRTDVSVDPAYGRWAPARAVVVQYPTPFTPAAG